MALDLDYSLTIGIKSILCMCDVLETYEVKEQFIFASSYELRALREEIEQRFVREGLYPKFNTDDVSGGRQDNYIMGFTIRGINFYFFATDEWEYTKKYENIKGIEKTANSTPKQPPKRYRIKQNTGSKF